MKAEPPHGEDAENRRGPLHAERRGNNGGRTKLAHDNVMI